MEPLVSIILLTYNHEKYIASCLDSVLAQQTDFVFEIILGEDCSSDNTREICEDYAKRYPDQIILPKRDKNLGLGQNLIQTLALAKGQFVAFQEGDDVWLNPNKLQLQMDVLRKNENYIGSVHNVKVLYPEGEQLLLKQPQDTYQLKDHVEGRIFHTNSWLVRKEYIPDFKKYEKHLICWDILLECRVFQSGPVHCINDTYSVWRKHEDGNSVKIPILNQYKDFEALYFTLLQDAKDTKDAPLVKHYKRIIKNFYSIFSIEITRRTGQFHKASFLKSIYWQCLTFSPKFGFLPNLIRTYLKFKPS